MPKSSEAILIEEEEIDEHLVSTLKQSMEKLRQKSVALMRVTRPYRKQCEENSELAYLCEKAVKEI